MLIQLVGWIGFKPGYCGVVSLGLHGGLPRREGYQVGGDTLQAGIAVLVMPLEVTWRFAAGWEGSCTNSRYQSYPHI